MIPDLNSSNTAVLQGSEYLKITNQAMEKTQVIEWNLRSLLFDFLSTLTIIICWFKDPPVQFPCFSRTYRAIPGQVTGEKKKKTMKSFVVIAPACAVWGSYTASMAGLECVRTVAGMASTSTLDPALITGHHLRRWCCQGCHARAERHTPSPSLTPTP